MIDEYESDTARRRLYVGVLTSGKAFLVGAALLLTVLTQIVTMIAVLHH